MSSISEVFRTLNEWRHLPAYQLERRVDVFFGLFLAEVIEKIFGVSDAKVIPEFPLHKGMINNESENNRSANVDFAVFAEKGKDKQIFLVELKTDIKSLNRGQLENMRNARTHAESKGLLTGVKKAAVASRSKPKYAQLIARLIQLECLHLDAPNELTEKRPQNGKPGLKSVFEKLKIGKKWANACVHLLVILPKKPKPEFDSDLKGFHRIYFSDFAKKVDDRNEVIDSDFVRVFKTHLEKWTDERAGLPSPRN